MYKLKYLLLFRARVSHVPADRPISFELKYILKGATAWDHSESGLKRESKSGASQSRAGTYYTLLATQGKEREREVVYGEVVTALAETRRIKFRSERGEERIV